VFAALAQDLKVAVQEQKAGSIANRLNIEESGLRTVFMRAARRVASQEEGPWAPFFEAADPAWMQPAIWGTIRNLSSPTHSLFFLSALDARRMPDGSIVAQPEDQRIHVTIYLRTLGVALTVTLMCILLGFPLAYLLAHLRDKTANLLLILVLLPFWTSLLVRTTAWMVVLQKEGVINSVLQTLGLIAEPLPLVFNRFGVVAAMTHILLPFMILPMYSVMRQIPPSYVRAARSLGASPSTAFLRVYLPQCVPGVGAGALLVFILALGYYITPALLGGSTDQMISYFVADNMGRSLNWGLASALAAILLAAVLVLYALYDRIAGPGNLKLG
jgi:putative spermidine/putrescine transport system permease protein